MTAFLHTESVFEAAIVRSLVEQGGYTETSAADFSRDLALDKHQVLAFLQETEPAR